ncbi:hypothetical protein PSV09DRAFT_2355151 [Bipolaris maydis]|nr:hypothetical protein PSV09DRAFT_2355151 [Bipolaris maydis]
MCRKRLLNLGIPRSRTLWVRWTVLGLCLRVCALIMWSKVLRFQRCISYSNAIILKLRISNDRVKRCDFNGATLI